MLDAIKHVTDSNLIFQQGGALMHTAFNTVQQLWCKHPSSFLSGLLPKMVQNLTPMMTRF